MWNSVVWPPRSIILVQNWSQKQSYSPSISNFPGGACPQTPLGYSVLARALQTWSLQIWWLRPCLMVSLNKQCLTRQYLHINHSTIEVLVWLVKFAGYQLTCIVEQRIPLLSYDIYHWKVAKFLHRSSCGRHTRRDSYMHEKKMRIISCMLWLAHPHITIILLALTWPLIMHVLFWLFRSSTLWRTAECARDCPFNINKENL